MVAHMPTHRSLGPADWARRRALVSPGFDCTHKHRKDFCIVEMNSGLDVDVHQISANHRSYANRHGYGYCTCSKADPARRVQWTKYLVVSEAMHSHLCRTVMWIDADMLFTAPVVPHTNVIRTLERPNVDAVFGAPMDCTASGIDSSLSELANGEQVHRVNNGIWAVSNSTWAQTWLSHLWLYPHGTGIPFDQERKATEFPFYDNDALHRYLRDKSAEAHLHMRFFNGNGFNVMPPTWRPGAVHLHLAGTNGVAGAGPSKYAFLSEFAIRCVPGVHEAHSATRLAAARADVHSLTAAPWAAAATGASSALNATNCTRWVWGWSKYGACKPQPDGMWRIDQVDTGWAVYGRLPPEVQAAVEGAAEADAAANSAYWSAF